MWKGNIQGHGLINGSHHSLQAAHLSGTLMCIESFVKCENMPVSW
jgi:hypothetical protein